MNKQEPCQNADYYLRCQRRIEPFARWRNFDVVLKVRQGSGKTLVLNMVAASESRIVPQFILSLHRKFHKIFYRIVKSLQTWIDLNKAMLSQAVLALPATIGSKPMADKPTKPAEMTPEQRLSQMAFNERRLLAAKRLGIEVEPATFSASKCDSSGSNVGKDRPRNKHERGSIEPGTVGRAVRKKGFAV